MADLPPPAVAQWDFPRSAASVLLMTRFAEEHGISTAALLSSTHLTTERVVDPDAHIEAQQELAVVRNLSALLGDRTVLGLELGCRYRATTFGIFGFACMSSPTLRDAIAFALRYFDLGFAFCIPAVETGADEFVVQLHDETVPEDVRELLVERDLAAIYTVLGELLPFRLPLSRIQLRHTEPESVDAFIETFGIRPEFQAGTNVATFARAYLDRALPHANEHTVALCEYQCRELVMRRRARTGIAHQVRERLITLGGADTDMGTIARELNISRRTLRRKLDAAGTSYRALYDEVTETLAEEMLATGALSVSDVAIRLGYAEATSFIYAFKRWKGITPAAYQRGDWQR